MSDSAHAFVEVTLRRLEVEASHPNNRLESRDGVPNSEQIVRQGSARWVCHLFVIVTLPA